jgi:hypothetical protein
MANKDLIILAVIVGAGVVLAVLFAHFRQWGPRVWANRVRDHFVALNAERNRLLAEGKVGPAYRLRQMKDDLQRKHRRSVKPAGLADFPGIGPATVDKLTLAGVKSLEDLVDYPFESVPGFGPSRSADLRAAVRGLVHQTRAAFDAGNCPEGQEYLRAVGQLAESDRAAQIARDRRLTALDDALDDTRPLVEVADQITFYLYLEHTFSHKDVPGLSEGLHDRPLPEPAETTPAMPQAAPTQQSAQSTKPTTSTPPNPQLAKLRAYVRFGFVVARADGRVAKDERKAIRQFLGDTFGGDTVLVRFIDPEMEAVEADPPEEDAVLFAVAGVTTDAEKRSLVEFAERVADASGERNDREVAFLSRVRKSFGIAAEAPVVAAAKPASPATPTGPDPRTVLDIPPGVELTVELIRRKYAMVYDQNDPVKARSVGPEYVKMAEAKRAAAKAAAEALLAPFGAPLEAPAAPPPPTDIRHNPDLDDVFGR